MNDKTQPYDIDTTYVIDSRTLAKALALSPDPAVSGEREGDAWAWGAMSWELRLMRSYGRPRVRVLDWKVPYGPAQRRVGARVEVTYSESRSLPLDVGLGLETDEHGEVVRDYFTVEVVVHQRSLRRAFDEDVRIGLSRLERMLRYPASGTGETQ